MTVPREPGDPGRPGWPDDDLEVYLRSDPELAEGPSGFGRIAVYAVAALLIVGAVLYGMNQNGTTTATNPPANTAANTPNSAADPQRDAGAELPARHHHGVCPGHTGAGGAGRTRAVIAAVSRRRPGPRY